MYAKAYQQNPFKVLLALIGMAAFCLGHAECVVKENNWSEPIIIWIATALPTGKISSHHG